MDRLLFGDDNAVFDPLLHECFVEPKEVSKKPILIGRWGIGKSAIFFNSNNKLTTTLEKIDESFKNLWYIGENAFDPEMLLDLWTEDKRSFQKILEKIWKAEILRTLSVLLIILRKNYRSHSGDHWDAIQKITKSRGFIIPIWKRLADVVGVFTGLDKGRKKALASIEDGIDKLFVDETYKNIQTCLNDIKDDEVQPIIVIEPVDTPSSKLEKVGKELAQPLVNSLLNVFYSSFNPTNQNIKLKISIPWNRYVPRELDYPQRFPSYVGHIKWNVDSLRRFINKRISWEFKRIKRTLSARLDPFASLFDEFVVNNHCLPKVNENSFLYFVRHTHYRPRDLQRLVRIAVEKQAFETQSSIDDVLLSRGGQKISSSVIRNSIQEFSTDVMPNEFIPEVERKFSNTMDMVDLLYGISVPFDIDNIKKRFEKTQKGEINPFKLNEVVDQLWESGIIGVEIYPKTDQATDSIREILNTNGLRTYTVGKDNKSRWYFFEYNWHGKPAELISRYNDNTNIDARLVLHPRTFEYLLPSVSRDFPIGS